MVIHQANEIMEMPFSPDGKFHRFIKRPYQMNTDISLKAGTISGTVLSILPNILSEDIIKTVLLAAVGATVSFTITLLLKWITSLKKK